MGSFWRWLTNTPRTIRRGLRVTMANFRRTKNTVRYPEVMPAIAGRQPLPAPSADPLLQPYEMAPRYRGLHGLTRNPATGDVNCIGCLACAMACPDQLISMDLEKREGHSGRYPVTFTIDIGPCCFCGLCSEVCPTPFRALVMTDVFEWATYERFGRQLTLDRDDLLRNGDFETARRAAGRTISDAGDLVAIVPEEEGNPYFQFAAESAKGKKKAEPTARPPLKLTDPPAAAGPPPDPVSEVPPPPDAPMPAAAPRPAAPEPTVEDLRARLASLLAEAGVSGPEALEEITPEQLEAIEDRKCRSLAKVARRKLRQKLGLGE